MLRKVLIKFKAVKDRYEKVIMIVVNSNLHEVMKVMKIKCK